MGWITKKITKLKATVEQEKFSRSAKRVESVCVVHGEAGCVRCAGDDFEAQAEKVTRWEALEEDDLKRIVKTIPKRIVDLMKRHPGKVVIAGGFIRAIVADETIHDVDVYVNKESEAEVWMAEQNITGKKGDIHYKAMEEGREVQIIWRCPFNQAYEILEQFDYTVAKAAIWYDDKQEAFKSICHERFYRDLARKMLVYDCERDVERIQSFPRLFKYIRYGYDIDPNSLAEVIIKTCLTMDLEHGFEGMRKQLLDCYQPTKEDAEWKELTKKYSPPPPPPARSHDYSYGS